MQPSVYIHLHAKQDILNIMATNKPAAAAILVTIEDLQANPSVAIDKLTTFGDNTLPNGQLIVVKNWVTAKHVGNLWRIRILDSPATMHRVIYGYHYQTLQLCVLAVVDKDGYDYNDHTSEINQRIFSDWREL